MFEQGGRGSSVRHLNPSDNRGAGLVSAATVEASQKEPSTDYCRRLMMSEKVEKLLSAASSALSDSPAILDPGLLASDGSVLSELVELLQKRQLPAEGQEKGRCAHAPRQRTTRLRDLKLRI